MVGRQDRDLVDDQAMDECGSQGGSATSMQWWFPFIGAARRHDYALQVRAIDAAGVIGSSVSTLFKVSR